MTCGFLLGKFMPPHAGHVFLCRTAAQLCDRLTVLVCSLPGDPIPGKLRYEWMRELLPGVAVVHHDQPVPQEPQDHPDFWEIWRNICRRAHPEPIDRVFGSEDYVNRLAAELSAEAVVLDTARLAFPVSGTAVRRNPASVWRFVPGPVRPYYQKRVVLFGAESTGKSTLAVSLARNFDTLHVPEYGRIYDANRKGAVWTKRDFEAIVRGHEAMRAAIAPEAGYLLFEDTDPLLTRVWEEYLLGETAAYEQRHRLADLYLLLDPDIPWLDDGTRYQGDPAARERFHLRCRQLLEEVGANWRPITGSNTERLSRCLAAVDELARSCDSWRREDGDGLPPQG